MKANRFYLIALCLLLTAGCSTISSKKVQYLKNYTVNVEKQTLIRTPMVTTEKTKYIRGRSLSGEPQSQDYWQDVEYPSMDSFREELIYAGRTGNKVRITYMRKDATMPVFYKELTYDLGSSDIIMFNNFKIKVLDATNKHIRFIVLKD